MRARSAFEQNLFGAHVDQRDLPSRRSPSLSLDAVAIRPPLPQAPGAVRQWPDNLLDLDEAQLLLITSRRSGKVIMQRIVLSQCSRPRGTAARPLDTAQSR
jgi:hypothetical protein